MYPTWNLKKMANQNCSLVKSKHEKKDRLYLRYYLYNFPHSYST